MDEPRVMRVGAARVTIVNAGMMTLRLADEFAVPESEWRPAYAEIFDHRRLYPSLSALIELEGARVLVDANDYRATVTEDSEYHVPNYTPPPAIADQFAGLGTPPDAVSHVVITHAHWDHFAGLTRTQDGAVTPTFPNARVYLGSADWSDAETQASLADPASLEARTLGALHARGLLTLVSGDQTIAPDIDLLAAPGETAGHQIVRVQSNGETLYVLGDLLHSEVEVERPDWMVTWAMPETMRASRQRLLENALAERALLVAAHIGSVGRLERAGNGLRWAPVD